MIIGCPECATRFGIADDVLGTAGRRVRCAKCSHVWLATAGDAIVVSKVSAPKPQPASQQTIAPKPEVPEEQVTKEDVPTPTAEPAVVEEPIQEPAPEETPQEDFDGKDLGSDSVEEALAAIKGSAIEEPDFPLEKGQISERKFLPNKNTILIGWAALGALIIILLLVFVLMQQTLERAWPPMTQIYSVFGMTDASSSQEQAEDEEIVDLSQYINITNDATFETLADGTPELVIRGSVTNNADFDIELPMVDVVLRNERRQDIYVWSFQFDETTLKAGKTMPFIESIHETPRETTEYELMLLWDE